jgi:hypothetical protein
MRPAEAVVGRDRRVIRRNLRVADRHLLDGRGRRGIARRQINAVLQISRAAADRAARDRDRRERRPRRVRRRRIAVACEERDAGA